MGERDGGPAAGGSGARLRQARQARGFSQQQLAGMAAVSPQAGSAVESGLSDPSLRGGPAPARALGLTVEELLGPGAPERQVDVQLRRGAVRAGRTRAAGGRPAGGVAG